VLGCQEYKELEFIFISASVNSSKLEIKGGSYTGYNKEKKYGKHKTKIIHCQPTRTYLQQNYPQNGTCQIRDESIITINNFGKTRAEIKELVISGEGLEGNLDLSDFPNLEELTCSANCLTNLNLNNCRKLK